MIKKETKEERMKLHLKKDAPHTHNLKESGKESQRVETRSERRRQKKGEIKGPKPNWCLNYRKGEEAWGRKKKCLFFD